jgi:uncharacterized protein (DUF4415 family)
MKNTSKKKRHLTDAEEAAIQAQIANDPDAAEATDKQLLKAKPFGEALPELMDVIRRGRGRPSVANPRTQISLRLDGDVIEKFKSTGKGWQSRVNAALRKAAGL